MKWKPEFSIHKSHVNNDSEKIPSHLIPLCRWNKIKKELTCCSRISSTLMTLLWRRENVWILWDGFSKIRSRWFYLWKAGAWWCGMGHLHNKCDFNEIQTEGENKGHFLTASPQSKSRRYTAHLWHLSSSLASCIILVTRHSRLLCSAKMFLARFNRIWLRWYSWTDISNSWAFCMPIPQNVR